MTAGKAHNQTTNIEENLDANNKQFNVTEIDNYAYNLYLKVKTAFDAMEVSYMLLSFC